MYNFLGSTILGSSIGFFLLVSIGDDTGWEAWMPVGILPEEKTVASLSDSNDGIGKLELEMIFNKRWVSGVK